MKKIEEEAKSLNERMKSAINDGRFQQAKIVLLSQKNEEPTSKRKRYGSNNCRYFDINGCNLSKDIDLLEFGNDRTELQLTLQKVPIKIKSFLKKIDN